VIVGPTFPRTLSAQVGSSDTVTASVVSTTETDFATVFSLPANLFNANTVIAVYPVFEYTSSATPPTLTVRGKLGATVVRSTITIAPAANQTARGIADGYLMQGTAAPGASVNVETGLIGFHLYSNANLGNNTAQPVAVATNGALVVTISAQWGANTAGNSITLRQLIVEQLAS
jgi:hypothetical protein